MNEREAAARLRQAIRQVQGDDLERAELAFRGLTPAQLQEPFGHSGRTKQQVLDEYREHRARDRAAQEFLEVLLRERGL